MSSPTQIAKDLILSPLFGTFGMLLVYGIALAQVHRYYNHCTSDLASLKALVGLIILLETLHLVFACHYIYFYLIEHYGETDYLGKIVWSFFLSARFGFVAAWIVNMFFIRRIYSLSSRNIWLCMIISVLTAVRPVLGFVGTSFAFKYPTWTVFYQHTRWIFIAGLSTGLVDDFLIAAAVSYYLLKAREAGARSTRNIVNLLLWYTMNTTAILTVFAVVEMVFLVREPNTLIFYGLFQVQIQLYANCFLASINARQSLRQETPLVAAFSMPTFAASNRVHIPSVGSVVKNDALINTQLESGETGFNVDKVSAV